MFNLGGGIEVYLKLNTHMHQSSKFTEGPLKIHYLLLDLLLISCNNKDENTRGHFNESLLENHFQFYAVPL